MGAKLAARGPVRKAASRAGLPYLDTASAKV